MSSLHICSSCEYRIDKCECINDEYGMVRFTQEKQVKESTGGKTDFYDCSGCKDVDDLAEHWDLRGDEFNCLKAIVGIAKGSRHKGTDPVRDANKLIHYANRILNRLKDK